MNVSPFASHVHPAAIVSEYTFVAVDGPASVTLTVTVNGLPLAVVGVPEMMPVVGAMLKPAGNPVADQVYAPMPPVAVMVVAGYGWFKVPAGNEAGPVMLNAATPTQAGNRNDPMRVCQLPM